MRHGKMNRNYRRRLDYIGSFVFLVMVLVASIHQGQTGSNGLTADLGGDSRSLVEPLPTTRTLVEAQDDESEESIDRELAEVRMRLKALEAKK
jgi:hypothetical protein